jgi:hypothetical protein
LPRQAARHPRLGDDAARAEFLDQLERGGRTRHTDHLMPGVDQPGDWRPMAAEARARKTFMSALLSG